MSTSFVEILALIAVQRYLGLGGWVWIVWGVCVVLDYLRAKSDS